MELDLWKEAKALVKAIYLLTRKFPDEEKWGLTQQMRRAAISIPSNIAEGIGRNHNKDVIQFLYISRGSLYELQTQLHLALDLEYITQDMLNEIILSCDHTGKLLAGFINYYETKQK